MPPILVIGSAVKRLAYQTSILLKFDNKGHEHIINDIIHCSGGF